MSGISPDNPFASLFVDTQPFDPVLLAKILKPYVLLYKSEPYVEFTKAGEQQTIKGKILLYLLAKKALKETGVIEEEEEKATPSEIEQITGLKGGSIRPTLKRLLEDRLVRVKGGGYFVPNHVLPEISRILTDHEEQ